MKKFFILLFAVIYCAMSATAQVSGYVFSQANTTYTPVTGAAVIISGWDDNVAAATIPFSFTFNNTAYTALSVNSNGYITFGATTSSTTNYTPISSTAGYAGVVSAFGHDLISNTTTIDTATVGAAPNRRFVVQWNNARRYDLGAITGDVINFQIVLNEAGGVVANQTVQVVFGTCTATSTLIETHQVGLRGTVNTDFNNRTTATNWAATTAGASNSSTCTTTNTIMPASGQVYTWTPPAPCTTPADQPTGLSLTPFNAGQINGSFAAAPSAPNGYLVVRYASGATPTNPVNATTYTAGGALGTGTIVQSGAAVSFSATGLNPTTTYDFYAYSMNNLCSGGPNYLTTAPLTGSATTPAQTPPTCATTYTPATAATAVPITQVLSWSGASGSPAITGYNVYLSTNSALVTAEDPSVRVSTNQSGTTFTPSPALSYSTTYYWKAVPINSIGASTGCVVNNFTTYVSASITSTAIGGLWNSPATWQGGVVPLAGDDVTIADGAIVTVNVAVSGIRNLTVGQGASGILQWTNGSFTMTLFGNLTVSNGARFLPYTTANTGQTINIGGNLVNNGFANMNMPSTLIIMNGSQQAGGSLAQTISGTGTFLGNGTQGLFRNLFFTSTGSNTISTTQNLATGGFAHGAGTLITNNKLSIDNTLQVFGQPINQQVASIAVTNMGSAYTSTPVAFGAVVSPWVASATAVVGTRYFSGGNVYLCATAGAFDAVNPPTHTAGVAANGAAGLLWLAPYGTLGTPFILTATTVGTQYFYGGNLYVCTVAGVPDPLNPPVHVSGTAASGAATFLYVGNPATVSVNYDGVTSTVRSLTLTSAGNGYSSAPGVTINGGGGTGAAATASFIQSIAGFAVGSSQKSGVATISGGLNINSTQGAISQSGVGGVSTSNGGVNYTVAPTVGFAGPTGINLVTAGGSGYTTAPTITVTGGTLVTGTALSTSSFVITVNQGRVISVYLSTGTTATYSVPPTLAFTGGGGAGATLEFPVASWPTATATIGGNGQLTNFTVTNAGYGYIAAPTVGIGTTSGTALGGTFTTVATAPTCRIALYNVIIDFFAPAPVNAPNTDDAVIPVNRKINALTLGSTTPSIGNMTLASNLEIFGTTPLTLNTGTLDMGGNTVLFSSPSYAGASGSLTANISNASITLSTRGGGSAGVTLNYPFEATFTAFTGSAATTSVGSTITSLTVNRTPAPTGGATGTRAYRAVTNGGAVYGTNPTVTLNYNLNDLLLSDQQSLFVGQAAANSGPWTTRSVTSGTGALATTGSRTTATAAPGPIAPTGNDYYAWVTTYSPVNLAYNITRSTGITYNSIMATGTDLPWGTAGSVSNDDITASVSLTAITGGAPTFQYQGQPITGFSMCSNGWVKLNTAGSPSITSTAFGNNLAALTNIVAPFWEDLTTNPNGGSSAGDLLRLQNAMKYKVIGTTAGSRQIVIEWKNMTVFGAAGPQLNFQVVLNEVNNTISINYGLFQGFNGTNNHRYTYSTGLSGQLVNLNPLPGQVLAQQYENTAAFSSEYASTASVGSNGLMSMPECNSALLFTPGAYAGFTPPANTPPANDEAAGAFTIPALTAFPANLCGNFYTSRNATPSAQAVCAGNNDDDVWFKFTANQINTTVRVYGSGGYVPRVQILDASLAPLSPAQCVVGSAGGTSVDANLTGLTLGNVYNVRVYHDGGGVQATATTTINGSGQVNGVVITNGGSGYTATTTSTPSGTATARVRFTGGGGRDAAGIAVLTGTAVSSITISNTGYGYTSAPTVTIEKPDWAHIGEFAIVVYAPAINDECSGAKTLTNLTNTGCVLGQNSANDNTGSATPSAEATVCGTPDDDVWFKFTAVNTNTHIDVTGTGSFDAAFQVFDGGAGAGNCGTKTSVACINTTGAGLLDSATVATTIGNTYFVRIYHAGAGTVTGETFNICVSSAPPACVNIPVNPPNEGGACVGVTTLSWPAIAGANSYDVYLDAGSGPATTLVSTQAGLTFNTAALTAGPYAWRVVPKNIFGSAAGCGDFIFTVNPKPTVSVSPAGPVTICAPATQTLSGTTNAALPVYKWLNNNAVIPGATAVNYSAGTSGSYRLVIVDGATGCTDTSVAVVLTVNLPPATVITPATATISCDSVKLSVAGASAIKITEVTLLKTGIGQTVTYPVYATGSDFVEISNISAAPVNMGGYIFADYSNNSATAVHPYTIPPGTIIPANGILTIHLGTGTDDPVNLYFNTGGTPNNWFSDDQVGVVIKDASGVVIDAVGCGGSASGYTFAAGTGVTAADWSGFASNVSGFAGVIRTGAFDNNNGTDWAQSNTPSPLQTIGTYNAGYTMPVYLWTPAAGLFIDAALTIPYTNQDVSVVYARPGSTTTYTVQATGGLCPGSSTATVTVLPAGTIEWTGAVSADWNTIGNWKCGGIPTTTSNVIINGGAPNYPLVTLNVEIKSLTVKPGAVVNVATGFEIKLNGN
jgi:hypothetical protein